MLFSLTEGFLIKKRHRKERGKQNREGRINEEQKKKPY
jgi:hypothetical protein